MFKTAFATLAAIGLATTALAQEAEIDADGDGAYSYPELLVALPDLTEDEFTVMDGNGDGLLDEVEIAAATEAGLMPVMEG